jgi:hypothetical protein
VNKASAISFSLLVIAIVRSKTGAISLKLSKVIIITGACVSPSIIFVSKIGAYPSSVPCKTPLALHKNIRLRWKLLVVTSALMFITEVKICKNVKICKKLLYRFNHFHI